MVGIQADDNVCPLHFSVSSGDGLPVQVVGLQVGSYLWLPLVSVAKQLLFVVEQLLPCLGRILKVGALPQGNVTVVGYENKLI